MQDCDFETEQSINLLTAFKSRAHVSQQIIDLIQRGTAEMKVGHALSVLIDPVERESE